MSKADLQEALEIIRGLIKTRKNYIHWKPMEEKANEFLARLEQNQPTEEQTSMPTGAWSECRCDCHNPGSTKEHCSPCCTTCDICGRNILGDFMAHKNDCAKMLD